ncbi:MAG: UDP-glucose/GDP-mannose dehydrogenase family protein [Anaerolineae bacterium]|nr:UDP-glucose/GDP-mannose dehydrogenase family protein [Anaerolineae bacterium]
MNCCVYGLWHLGTVISVGLAKVGHTVIGLDDDPAVITNFSAGKAPIFEPGVEDLLREELASGAIRFTTDPAALKDADIVWISFDTPVDDEDRADVDHVLKRVQRIFPAIPANATVLISSQVPIGSTAALARQYAEQYPERGVTFAYSPENLRLGNALNVFLEPDRVVIGISAERDRDRLAALFAPITDKLEWMSVESAEMTKHALNAFLGLSIAFMNEIAILCERTGADAAEVERGLKSEMRIGPRAYLRPGAAFAGGTLARDLVFLGQLGSQHETALPVLNGALASNQAHKLWAYHALKLQLGDLSGKQIAILGLTYKAGTSTLRRSTSLDLCRALLQEGAIVTAYDPKADPLPDDLANVQVKGSALEALTGSHAAVIATEWAEFRDMTLADCQRVMAQVVIIDPNRFVAAQLGGAEHYLSVGRTTTK